jgi:hypothetical protein
MRLMKSNGNQQELVQLALQERGILFKLIQNISPELLEQPLAINHAISKNEIIKIIEKNLNINFSKNFTFLSNAIFCASIGQVHRAIMNDGTVVAIKIQYPEVKNSVKAQLSLLTVAAIGSNFSKLSKWKIDINEHIVAIKERLEEELNYTHELKNLIHYSALNSENKIIPYSSFSSQIILTQSWIEGKSLVERKTKRSLEERKSIANLLIEQYLRHVFVNGFCQGDNNISNFIISDSPLTTHWIDFGNWIHITEHARLSLYTLIDKTIRKEDVNYLGHFQSLGFDLQKLQFFQNLLPSLVEILFDPFILNLPFDIRQWKIDERINLLLGENKWWFRSSGDSVFLELMKSFFGFIKIIEYLDVNINWQMHFLKLAPSFNQINFDQDIPIYPNTIPQQQQLAKQLIIQVFKNSLEHVKIELPSSSFFDLESFIPDDVKIKLKERSLNLSEIKFNYLKNGLIPGNVFVLNDGDTSFHISLR